MLYCDYTRYLTAGGTMTNEQYAVYGARAGRMIDRLTLGRAARALEAHPDELAGPLADAAAQIADVLLQNAGAVRAAAAGLASANTDGYAESYASGASAALYASVACRKILADALGADPYGLLYAGVS